MTDTNLPGPATLPESMIIPRLCDLPVHTPGLTAPQCLHIARDTREIYIDMEYLTLDHMDMHEIEAVTGAVVHATILPDNTVAVELHGNHNFVAQEAIPFAATSDMRIVSRFEHFAPRDQAIRDAMKRHPAGKKRRFFK